MCNPNQYSSQLALGHIRYIRTSCAAFCPHLADTSRISYHRGYSPLSKIRIRHLPSPSPPITAQAQASRLTLNTRYSVQRRTAGLYCIQDGLTHSDEIELSSRNTYAAFPEPPSPVVVHPPTPGSAFTASPTSPYPGGIGIRFARMSPAPSRRSIGSPFPMAMLSRPREWSLVDRAWFCRADNVRVTRSAR